MRGTGNFLENIAGRTVGEIWASIIVLLDNGMTLKEASNELFCK